MAGKSKRIFLDYASTTPVDKSVVLAMQTFFSKIFANPSALYREGVLAKSAVSKARKTIARILSVHSEEIFFTGSGTESANLAIRGVFESVKEKVKNPHIIISSIEHPAVLQSARLAEKSGASVTIIPVNSSGLVSLNDIKAALRPTTIIVSIMQANNEVGSIEPIKEIGKFIKSFRKSKKTNTDFPYFHTDSSQAANYYSINTNQLGVDLLTLDASKIYGPKGIGALYVRRGVPISPIIAGGGQESGLRSGTENVAAIAGMAEALSLADEIREKESRRILLLRDYCIEKVLANFPGSSLNGTQKNRLPNNINICFQGIDAEFAVIKLDSLGIQCSSSSSCRSLEENTTSYVVSALGKKDCAGSSLRFSLGRFTTKSDINQLLKALKKVVV
jgi:cysteine desulfurase